MTAPLRSILHVDMDAFFASVECVDFPELRGKPMLVGGGGGRGVVSTASYEARKYGCRSAQPMAVALRLCPHAIVRKVRYDRYREVSNQVFEIFERYTPLVQGLSLDEAFLDLTGTEKLHGNGESVARRIRAEIFETTGCTASVGVSHNKFLAKLASDLEKPDGLTIFGLREVEERLPTLSIAKIWGVGPKTFERLQKLGLHTLGDLRRSDPAALATRLGSEAERYMRLAHGLDDRPVVPERDAKSIGQERTFGVNLDAPDDVLSAMLGEVEQVGARVRRAGVLAGSITVKIRYGNFETITRQSTLHEPSDLTPVLWQAAKTLFETWSRSSFQPVRLIGVQAGNLSSAAGQMPLFVDASKEKLRRIDTAIDAINKKLGSRAVGRGRIERER